MGLHVPYVFPVEGWTMKKRPYLPAVVWILLVALTCASVTLEKGAASIAGSMVVLIALYKSRLIFIQFMELGPEVKPYRLLFELWAALAVLIILGGHWYEALVT